MEATKLMILAENLVLNPNMVKMCFNKAYELGVRAEQHCEKKKLYQAASCA